MVVQWLRLPAPNAEGRVRPLVRYFNEYFIKKKKKKDCRLASYPPAYGDTKVKCKGTTI